MRVEPAMGETRLLHQIGDPDAMRALLAKPHRGFLDDPGMGLELVFPGITHRLVSIICLESYNSSCRAGKLYLISLAALLRPSKTSPSRALQDCRIRRAQNPRHSWSGGPA